MNIDEFDEENVDAFMDKMFEMGLLEIHGVDPITQQITYTLTDKCIELFPELFEEHKSHVNEIAFQLWKKGYIEMMFDTDGVPMAMLKKEIDYLEAFKDMNIDEITFIQNMFNHYQK